MKTKKIFFVCSFLLVFILSAYSQEKTFQVYYVVEDYIKPSMVFEYEETLKELIQYHKDYKFELPVFVFKTDDNYYYYSYPVEPKFAALDSINKLYSKLGSNDKDRWKGIFAKFKGTYNYSRSFLIVHNMEHSYSPEEDESEKNYREFTYVYGNVGMEDEFKDACKEWVKIFDENDLPLGFDTYTGYTGTEQPFFMWITRAESPIDFWTKAEINNKFFEENEKHLELWKKTLKTIRKIEVRNAWYVPDYSYVPEK